MIMSRKRKQYSTDFKAKVVLAALKGNQTPALRSTPPWLASGSVNCWVTPPGIFKSKAANSPAGRSPSLESPSVRVSMDGKGYYRDNIFVERSWRSVKYECVSLMTFEDGAQLRQELRT